MATDSEKYCITLSDVQNAAKRIEGVAHRTPVMTSQSLIGNKAKNYFFKVEAMQKTGSFKFRGALNAIKSGLEEKLQKADGGAIQEFPVVTHSSGNHAQALALAAKLSSATTATESPISVPATIVMPKDAPHVKKQAVQDFGATIIQVENTSEARKREADKVVATTGANFIHPSEDPRVIAGQGTTSLEFVQQVRELTAGKDLDAIIIPVGGGGLAAGNTIALRGILGDKIKIILAEPSELDDAKRSFTEGKLLKHHADNKLNSVADGLKTTLGPNTWPIIRDMVNDIFTVSEEQILRATKLVWERLKVCIEPSAGVGVAVAMSDEFNGKYTTENGIYNVGIILCGGNVDVIKIAALMADMGI